MLDLLNLSGIKGRILSYLILYFNGFINMGIIRLFLALCVIYGHSGGKPLQFWGVVIQPMSGSACVEFFLQFPASIWPKYGLKNTN